MNRRRFLTMAAGGAAAAAMVACGDGVISGLAPIISGGNGPGPGTGTGTGPVTAKVADYPDLAANGFLVAIAGTNVAVKRTGATTFDAISLACTHAGCRCDIVNNAFLCPCHFSAFDNNGEVTAGPAGGALARRSTTYDAATDTLTIN